MQTNRVEVEQSKQLVVAFISDFLGIDFAGFQSGFGYRPDMILFHAPSGSTLCIDTDVLLMPQEAAREAVRVKLEACEQSFKRGVH